MANDRNGNPITPGTAYVLVGSALRDDGTTTLIDLGQRVVSATSNQLAPVGGIGTAMLGHDITAAGKALLDDANNTAQRATLGLGSSATLNIFGSGDPLGVLTAIASFAGLIHTHAPADVTGSTSDGQVFRRASGANGWGTIPSTSVTGLGTAATQNTFGSGDPLGVLTAIAAFAAIAHGHVPADLTVAASSIVANSGTSAGAAAAEDSTTLASDTPAQGVLVLGWDASGRLRAFPVGDWPSANSAVMMPPHFSTAALTSTKTITSGSTFAVYIGRAPKALSSVQVRYRVTTAAASITWAEVAIAKGAINVGGNPTLTVVGYTSVSGVVNSLGQKTTTVSVSGGQSINVGDDLWVLFGNSATTALQVRAASIADDLQVGLQASLATRPSTNVGTGQAYTIEGATTLAAWAVLIL